MKNFTLCFYENPGALIEIKQWENLKFNQITDKQIWQLGVRIYTIGLDESKCNGYNQEVLLCIPIASTPSIKKSSVDNLVFEYLDGEEYPPYYKTIIFGKTTSDNLENILNIVKEFENGK